VVGGAFGGGDRAMLDVGFWDIARKSAYHVIASVSSGDIQDA